VEQPTVSMRGSARPHSLGREGPQPRDTPVFGASPLPPVGTLTCSTYCVLQYADQMKRNRASPRWSMRSRSRLDPWARRRRRAHVPLDVIPSPPRCPEIAPRPRARTGRIGEFRSALRKEAAQCLTLGLNSPAAYTVSVVSCVGLRLSSSSLLGAECVAAGRVLPDGDPFSSVAGISSELKALLAGKRTQSRPW
jgi:hypothetical protein